MRRVTILNKATDAIHDIDAALSESSRSLRESQKRSLKEAVDELMDCAAPCVNANPGAEVIGLYEPDKPIKHRTWSWSEFLHDPNFTMQFRRCDCSIIKCKECAGRHLECEDCDAERFYTLKDNLPGISSRIEANSSTFNIQWHKYYKLLEDDIAAYNADRT